MELRRIVAAPDVRRGLELMEQLGATAVVLPELDALRGVEQNRFHHADVYGHTLEVLARTIALGDAAGTDAEEGGGRVAGETGAEAREIPSGSPSSARRWPRCWPSRSPTG